MISKNQLINLLEQSHVSDRLKKLFFTQFSTFCAPKLYESDMSSADVLIITDRIHIDQIKDVIAIKSASPQKKCCILTVEPPRSYISDLCAQYVDQVIVFHGGFELGMLLSMVREGTPVITRHRIPQLVFVTYSFPLRHIYRPYGFLYTTKLRENWEHYLADERGYTESFMIQNSQAVYHLEGDRVSRDILERFGVKAVNIFPACMDEFMVLTDSDSSGAMSEPHVVYMSSEPHKYVLPFTDMLKKSKVHLHVYLPYYYEDPSYSAHEYMKRGLVALLNESYNNPYFHLHPEYSYEHLVKEISKYDFAFPFFDFPDQNTSTPVATNFFAALEAGLPLIVPRNSSEMARIVDEEQIGFHIDPEELTQLQEKMQAYDPATLKRNVVEARSQSLKFNCEGFVDLVFG